MFFFFILNISILAIQHAYLAKLFWWFIYIWNVCIIWTIVIWTMVKSKLTLDLGDIGFSEICSTLKILLKNWVNPCKYTNMSLCQIWFRLINKYQMLISTCIHTCMTQCPYTWHSSSTYTRYIKEKSNCLMTKWCFLLFKLIIG